MLYEIAEVVHDQLKLHPKHHSLYYLHYLSFLVSGPKFGTNVGKGLAIGSMVKTPANPPVLECPRKLEMRQLVQYKPVSKEFRDGLVSFVLYEHNYFFAHRTWIK